MRTFWKGDASIKTLFKSGEVVISSGYPDNAMTLQKEGFNVKFAVAKEGQFLWACGYGITPNIDPANLNAAYALLNWYDSPKAELFEAVNWDYQVANEDILKIAPQSGHPGRPAGMRRCTCRTRSPRTHRRTGMPGSRPGPR